MKPLAVFSASDYLMLDALRRRPMTTRELSHTIQVSSSKTLSRLHEYEKHGLVVKGGGHKWHAALVLWVTPSKDRVEGVTGEAVEPSKPSTVRVLDAMDAVQDTYRLALNAASTPQIAPEQVPDLSPAPEPPKPYVPPRTRAKGSPKAQRMAGSFNLPSVIEGRGELNMGGVAQCILCTVLTTPFKYGTEAICPQCARGGK